MTASSSCPAQAWGWKLMRRVVVELSVTVAFPVCSCDWASHGTASVQMDREALYSPLATTFFAHDGLRAGLLDAPLMMMSRPACIDSR